MCRLQGEPVNLREQHDACEFYNILVESLNEALKALGHEQIMNKILGGSYSDQKICKTCPHRYSSLYCMSSSFIYLFSLSLSLVRLCKREKKLIICIAEIKLTEDIQIKRIIIILMYSGRIEKAKKVVKV